MLLSFPYLFEVRALFCWPSPQDLFFGPSHLIRFTLFCTFSGWGLIFLTLWSDSLQPATLFFWPSNLLFFTLLLNSEPAGAFPDPLSLFSQPFLLLVWTFRPHFFNPRPLFFQPCPLIFSTFPRFFLTVGIWNSCFMLLCTAGPSLCWFWFVSFFFLSFLNSTALFFHPFIWFVLFLFLRFPSGVLTFLTLSSRLILYPVIWLVSSCSVLFSGLALFFYLVCSRRPYLLTVSFRTSEPVDVFSWPRHLVFTSLRPACLDLSIAFFQPWLLFFQWFSNPPPSFLKFWWPFHLMCFSFCPNLFEAGDRGLFWALAAVKPVQKSPLVPSWQGLECHAGIGRWSSDFGTLDEVCEVILMVQGTSYYKHKCTRASEDLSTRGIRTIDV